MSEWVTAAVSVATVVTSSVVGPVVVEYFKRKFEKKHPVDPLGEALHVNTQIIDKLEDMRDLFSAERAWLVQFHNGGHFYPTGKSIQKFTMVYELLKDGYPPCQHQFQGIPVSLFSKPINKLYNGEHVIVDSTDNGVQNFGITNYISEGAVANSYMFPVKTLDDSFVGIVGLDFENQIFLGSEDLKRLEIAIAAMSGVLCNYLKK